MRALLCLSAPVLLAGCGAADALTIRADPALTDALTPFVAYIDDDRITLEFVEDPTTTNGHSVAVSLDSSCAECFSLGGEGNGSTVAAGGVLGAQ